MRRGYVHVYTGDGKGKTTAALAPPEAGFADVNDQTPSTGSR